MRKIYCSCSFALDSGHSLSWFLVLTILGVPGVVSWVRNNGDDSFQERAREPPGMPLFRTNQFHDLFKCFSGIGHKNNVRPASIALLSYLLIRRRLLFPLHLCTSGTFILRVFSHFFYNINKMAFTVITVIKTLQ